MTDHDKKLAAHPRWQYQPGMCARDAQGHSRLVLSVFHDLVTSMYEIDEDDVCMAHDDRWDLVPDVESPATQGWMMAMLMEAQTGWGSSIGVMCLPESRWTINVPWGDFYVDVPEYKSFGQALTAALLRAWGEL